MVYVILLYFLFALGSSILIAKTNYFIIKLMTPVWYTLLLLIILTMMYPQVNVWIQILVSGISVFVLTIWMGVFDRLLRGQHFHWHKS